MKQIIINIILIICLIIIAILLTVIAMQRTKNYDTPHIKQKQSIRSEITPYYYDSGYWYNPYYWWYGNDYYRYRRHNNYNHNHNYNYNYNYNYPKHIIPNPNTKPNPNIIPIPTINTSSIPTIGAVDSETSMIEVIQSPELIAPTTNSIFPLPTLVSQHLPEEIPINPAELSLSSQSLIASNELISSEQSIMPEVKQLPQQQVEIAQNELSINNSNKM
jgi:hypothetical protein